MNLRKEGRDWVLAADTIALFLDKIEPGPVMNLAAGTPMRLEDLQRDLPQPLSAQAWRDVLDAQLRGYPENTRHLFKEVLIALRAPLELICEATQAIDLLALLRNAHK